MLNVVYITKKESYSHDRMASWLSACGGLLDDTVSQHIEVVRPCTETDELPGYIIKHLACKSMTEVKYVPATHTLFGFDGPEFEPDEDYFPIDDSGKSVVATLLEICGVGETRAPYDIGRAVDDAGCVLVIMVENPCGFDKQYERSKLHTIGTMYPTLN